MAASCKARDPLERAFLARRPLIYVHSSEETRVLRFLRDIAAAWPGTALPVHVWSCVTGFADVAGQTDTRDPLAALGAIRQEGGRGVFVMQDLSAFMTRPEVARALREVYAERQEHPERFVVILSPERVLPPNIVQDVHLIAPLPPDDNEIAGCIERVLGDYPGTELGSDIYNDVAMALKGLTLDEISHILHRILGAGLAAHGEILDEIFAEKEMSVRKSGFLQFAPPRWDIADVGGLENLKEWLRTRQTVFSREALESGLPMPKGLLIMGVSGCGKSLAIKVISALWRVPLFRLDMNLVFSGLYGNPEAAFHNALQTMESVAPAVLWIDEIENSLGIEEDKLTIASHIFSTFLTWMQEKSPLIFLAATANRIQALPAEIIRKGRFDQVFFVDLPTAAERQEILRIHLRRNNADAEAFDMRMLSVMTEGWNGAEIEQAVVSARIDAHAQNRLMVMNDLSASVSSIVPLSQTMEKQIKSIRNWAFTRATPASRTTRTH